MSVCVSVCANARCGRVRGRAGSCTNLGTAAGALDASFETHAKVDLFRLPLGVPSAHAPEPLVSLPMAARVHRLAWSGRGMEACGSDKNTRSTREGERERERLKVCMVRKRGGAIDRGGRGFSMYGSLYERRCL
jgi:hypothetical protein